MPAPSVERRLAAVLASEMVGYTGLIEQDGSGTTARLKALCQAVIEPIQAPHGGRIVADGRRCPGRVPERLGSGAGGGRHATGGAPVRAGTPRQGSARCMINGSSRAKPTTTATAR